MKLYLMSMTLCTLLAACGDKRPMTDQAKSFEAEIAEIKDAGVLQKRCASVDDEFSVAHAAVVTIGQKYPIFTIQGNVTDSEEHVLQIFGRAIVDPSTGLTHWASSGNERNILVVNPNNTLRNPSYYVGQHYFIKKDSGKNGFGAEVPVWVFGDPPEELAVAKQKRMAQELKRGMCTSRLQALKTAPVPIAQTPVQQAARPEEPTQPATQPTPSFDCAKASTSVERAICANSQLSRLDAALSNNVKNLIASDIGDGARADLRQSQRGWLEERNKCTTTECIKVAYEARMDAVCDIPVLSGVHPPCTSSDEVK